jgi:tetratricopeptide (TPR) repeat protein
MPPVRPSPPAFALATLAALAACDDGRLSPLNEGTRAPRGGAPETVAGLTVGHRLMEAGEYELALQEYLRAAGEEGLTSDVLAALGTANLRLGRLGQAERLLRRAVAEDEGNAAAWNNLGAVLMETGQAGEAARVFRLAFALDSGESVEIRENLRAALARLDNPAYRDGQSETPFTLVRGAGTGTYRILRTP